MPDINPAASSEIVMNKPILSIRNLCFTYPGNFSINIPNLDIKQGERIALIGPNGAGKTTLLQLIALLQKTLKGTITFKDKEIKSSREQLDYHRSTAFVPQRLVLYNRSVLENVNIGLKIRGLKREEIYKKTTSILKDFKIDHLANRNGLNISGGESRRVMLARALVLNPQILFMDEPFGDLDEPIRNKLIEDFLPILSRLGGCAVIFVTHNQDETYQLAERFMIMMKGEIIQSGSAREIFGSPLSPEVADFIGIKNIIPARVESYENGTFLLSCDIEKETTSQKQGLPVHQAVGGDGVKLYTVGDKPKTEKVTACIPPESIIISTGQGQITQTSPRNMLQGVVKRIIPSRYFSWVEVNCNGVILTASITNESIKELDIKIGKEVKLMIKATAIRILEK